MLQNQENYYWLFSSSSQTISAFVAFLVTGFALMLNIMDSQQQKDETLEDIHDKLKIKYYNRICILLVLTGIAIVSSLLMVYINGEILENKSIYFYSTVAINISAIIVAISFVIEIINPKKYAKVAREIIKDEKMEDSTKDNKIDHTIFINEFIELEKSIREKLKMLDLYVPSSDSTKMAYSFRQMINSLMINGLIQKDAYDNLLIVNKYRNLVFHGHQDKVDGGMLNKLRDASATIKQINRY